MFLRTLFRTRWQAVVATIAIIFILNASIQSIFFGSDREILYDHSTSVFLCLKDSTTCVYTSELKLANTGVEIIEDILVNFSDIPEGIQISHHIRNLNAGKPRDADPGISTNNFKDGNSIRIRNLSPGSLIVVKLSGDIPVEKKKLLAHLDINVESDSAVINADPQGTEFARLWSMFL